MHSVVRFTLRQQVLFNLIFVVLIVVGAFVVQDLAVERYPDINFGKVQITTIYPGASPRDVEALVTLELEEAIDGLEHVELIRASSVRERSTIMVKFREGSDYNRLYDELRFRVLGALDELPETVDPPHFQLIETSAWLPVVSVNLIGERSNRALSLIAEELRVPLSAIPGVEEAGLIGEQTREFHIALDPNLLARDGVTFDEVSRALTDANLIIPAGDYTDASGEYVIRVDQRFRSREQVVETVVRRDADGSFVRVEDLVAAVGLGYRDAHVINSVNGLDTVAVEVYKGETGNALDIMRAVEAVVAEFAPILQQEGVEVVLTKDSTTYITDAVATLGWNMIVGITLVGLILWYFMGRRNAGLVSVGIPFAFLVTMIMMWLTGNSLNEITLFSFVLVSGIVVDDAIVVTENIYRHAQDGEPLREAIVNGTAEVMLPVIAATATSVAAFLPMLLMTGSTGEFFALIPKAVTFAILASLFECLFILPLHYLDFGPRGSGKGLAAAGTGSAQPDLGAAQSGTEQGAAATAVHERDDWLLRQLRRMVRHVVGWTLRHRWISMIAVWIAFFTAVAVLLVSVAGVAPLIRIKFFPDDYNLYYVFVEAAPGTPIEEVDERVRGIAVDILEDGPGYARSAAGYAGFTVTEDYEEEIGHHRGTVMVALPAKDERSFDDPIAHLDEIRERMVARWGNDGFRIRVRPERDGPPSGKDVNIQVVGNDEKTVDGLADALARALREDPVLGADLVQLDDGRAPPARVLRMVVDESRAQELGLSNGQAARVAAAVLDGRYIGDYRVSDAEVDLKLRIDPAYIDSPERALTIPVLEHPTGPVRLGDIVRPVLEIQPSELKRYQGNRSRSITANIRTGADTSPALVTNWARERYRELQADYPGATLVFGGEYAETQRSFNSLFQAFGLALLVIYVILAAQFKSYLQPMLILSAVMFSIIGVVFGKFVSQSLFTVNSFVAVVGVTGVVVNDALVLIDFINRAYRSGMSRLDAIRHGLDVRLRPIVLTTLTTTLGLLPMALGIPSYSILWGSMASTFVTGLATATLLTLFIVPVGWDILTEWQERRAARRLKASAASA